MEENNLCWKSIETGLNERSVTVRSVAIGRW